MTAVPSTMGEWSLRRGGGLGARRGEGECLFRWLVGVGTLPLVRGSCELVVWPCEDSEGAPPSISRRARLTPASVRENLGGEKMEVLCGVPIAYCTSLVPIPWVEGLGMRLSCEWARALRSILSICTYTHDIHVHVYTK